MEGLSLINVSIIIPVYNVEDYLSKCLESVIGQTYKEIEIICIDDCSQDKSLDILTEYSRRDSRIIVLKNEKNSGLAYTRNIGLKKATGKYILFVDSDDVISRDLLEICMGIDCDADIIYFDYKQLTDEKRDIRLSSCKMREGAYEGNTFFKDAVRHDNIIFAVWTKLYDRNFLISNNIFFYNAIIYEDILFSFYCYLKAKKVYNLHAKLYEYRVRKNSIMTMDVTERNIESYMINICELTKLYLQQDFDPEMEKAIEEYIRMVCRDYISTYRKWKRREMVPKLLKDKSEYYKIYRIFSDLFVKSGKVLDISSKQLGKILQYDYVILYGAGDIARGTIEILDQYDIPLSGVVVSSINNNKKSILGNPVKELKEYYCMRMECLVLIGTMPWYYDEIEEYLQENGFLNWMEVIEGYDGKADNPI